jgi:hypothetical protein
MHGVVVALVADLARECVDDRVRQGAVAVVRGRGADGFFVDGGERLDALIDDDEVEGVIDETVDDGACGEGQPAVLLVEPEPVADVAVQVQAVRVSCGDGVAVDAEADEAGGARRAGRG